MGLGRSILYGLRRLLHPGAARRERDDEVRDFFESATESYLRAGFSPADAARQVRIQFGTEGATRDHAATGGWEFAVETLLRDIRYAIRSLRNNPGFTGVAVLSLGLGIGATTTMFSVIDAIDFRPLAFKNSDRLVWLAEVSPLNDEICSRCAWYTSAAMARAWTTQTHAFDAVASTVSGFGNFTWTHDDVSESLNADRASPGFFSVLAVPLLQGREFVAADTAAGAAPVAIITYEFWQTRLGGAQGVIGTTLLSRDDRAASQTLRPVTIIGVLPPHFHFDEGPPLWTPLVVSPRSKLTDRDIKVVGRLRNGQTLASSSTEVATISARFASEFPADYRDWGARTATLRNLLVGGVAKGRFVLFAITTLVLLIAVLNVAGLLLSRAATRQPEFAVRIALGAGRAHLLRQLLAEGACIGLAGGAIGVLLALGAVRIVPRWFAIESTGLTIAVDHRILLFAAVLSVIVGLTAAAAPAMRAASADPGGPLRSKPGNASIRAARTSNALIALQISLALVLLTAASLLSRDFLALRYLDIGYEPHGLYQTLLTEPGKSVDLARWRTQAEAARARVALVPGVVSVSLEYRSAVHPTIVRPDGNYDVRSEHSSSTLVTAVDPEYFTTFGMSITSGRPFTSTDERGAPAVGIVNQSTAAHYWPGQNPLGHRIFIGDSASAGELLTVVGVTSDAERGERFVRHSAVLYRPFAQGQVYHAAASLYLRVSKPAPSLLAAAQLAVRQEIGRTVAPFSSEEHRLSDKLLSRRFNAIALDFFAGFGMLLAALGIYGSVSYSVVQRTQEIGVRIALGAGRLNVVGLFARRVAILAMAGVVVGIVAAAVLSRVLASFLSATNAANPWIFVSAVMFMIVVACVATFVPARRATKVDAVIALRGE